jgi:hypothetical protein
MKESPLYQEILAEGRAEGHRWAIRELIGARFGEDARRELGDALDQIADADRLAELFGVAARCRRFTGFLRAVSTKA